MRKWIAIVTSVVAAMSAGCGSDDTSSGTATPAPAALRGAAFDIVTVKPLIGFDVCSVSDPSVACVKTDDNGNFKIPGLPANAEVLLSIKGDKYPTVLRTAVTGDPGSSTVIFDVLMPNNSSETLVLGQIGVDQDPAKGILIFEAITPDASATDTNGIKGVEGATATVPDSDGPYYLNATGFPDSTLTATSGGGHALVLNVPVGEAEVTMTAPDGKSCHTHPVLSWAGSSPLTARVPIEAGAISYSASMECDP